MNFYFVLLVFLSLMKISESAVEMINLDACHICHAINEISVKQFEGKFSNLRIISSITEDMRRKTYDIVSNLIVGFGSSLKVTIEEPKIIKNSSSKRGSPVIILINSMESFEKIKDTLVYNPMRFRKFYILILVNGIFPGIEKVVQQFWNFWIYNINVLSEDVSETITLRTFFPFSNGKCGNEKTLSIINSFDSVTRLWSSDVFFPEKLNNLHLCPLKIAALGSSLPSVIVKKNAVTGSYEFSGLEVEIIENIAKDLNLTVQYENFNVIGAVYPNGTTSDPIETMLPTLFSRRNMIAIGSLSLQYERVLTLTESKSFMSSPVVIVIPPSKELSAFAKVIRPLSELVWVLLLAVFIIGIMFITFLKTTSLKAYRFVVGKDVKYPILNMLIALVGNTQAKLPKLNFARFLLMKFLLFCLVIRSVYQGRLYNILQSNLHEKELATIDDIIENNMIFFAYESMKNRIQGFKFTDRFVKKL